MKSKTTAELGANPTLLSLLQAGCKIEFPSGYSLTGEPSTDYIQLATPFGQDGLWILGHSGLKNAMHDAREYEKQQDS